MWTKSLLLYNLDTLQLTSFVDNLDYEINDLAFHPTEKIIAIAVILFQEATTTTF
jgi:hypothetical protein